MNLEYFIARRFSSAENRRSMSRPAVRIAVTGIALGVAVMLISIAVIVGFKREVRKQITGFGSHIQILPQYSAFGVEQQYISFDSATIGNLKALGNVASVQNVVSRTGIIHTKEAFQGVIVKGVDSTYNWEFFKQNLLLGSTLDTDSLLQGAIISRSLANAMQLDTGSRFDVYFADKTLRARRFKVAGIYQTSFAEYDKLYIIAHLGTMQRLNGWQSGRYSQMELLLDRFELCDRTAADVLSTIITDPNYSNYRVETIETLTPQIFDWLDMLDMNAVVIMVLMIAVSGFCVISGLLILILERSATIGLFKSLGATNSTIRRIFLAQGSILISKGIVWGNVLGLAIIAIQFFTHIVPLDPESYYVGYVPVWLTFTSWLAINAGVALAGMAMLVAPTYIVTRISPAEAMRRE